MDVALFIQRGGVRSLGKFKLADGNEHELHFTSRTDAELADYFAQIEAAEKMTDARQKRTTAIGIVTGFVQKSMANEDGTALLTDEQARGIPLQLRYQLRDAIIAVSSRFDGDLGKD